MQVWGKGIEAHAVLPHTAASSGRSIKVNVRKALKLNSRLGERTFPAYKIEASVTRSVNLVETMENRWVGGYT